MAEVKITKGILNGLSLKELNEIELQKIAQSSARTDVSQSSFYKGTLSNATFQGITFRQCGFARATFNKITFSRCKFIQVDFTRAVFKDCFFSDSAFVECDPYYASFEQTEVDPSSFKKCFRTHAEWNKALILFSKLRLSLRELGENRSSRSAEYYFRVWQRRRLYHRWQFKRVSGFGSWFSSLLLGSFTGYGERPAYLAGWALAAITAFSVVYMRCLPYALERTSRGFWDYWYYSFKVFFAQGLSNGFQSMPLSVTQVVEFGTGLVTVALLIGSVSRKLSP